MQASTARNTSKNRMIWRQQSRHRSWSLYSQDSWSGWLRYATHRGKSTETNISLLVGTAGNAPPPAPALKTSLYWCLCAAQLKWWGYRLSASYSTKSGAVEIQPNHNQMAPRPTEDNNWGSRCSSWNVSIPCHTPIGGLTIDLCLLSEKKFATNYAD